ncbi:DUF2316 family protein [Streptomyces sp. NBC_01022]|uniref:DUF2316 family protein n=1 Tax=Streptomyces sp. NBC_01022 TaxID=2903723 RepID=UPI002DD8AD14|nr:DUF2316 family protein [Streptomyces sp. NBC_01022]WRZ79209.1 DUF2316 family protein [Streptomyces sp. NBC_01022]WRZ86467.1 DUF2316 family protein [Streptomyces sp. NBC_01022]
MTLNTVERHRTGEEFAQNVARSGLAPHDVAADLAFTSERLRQTLDVDPASDPVDVWQLRDYLQQAVLDAGGTPVPYSVLNDRSRFKARLWFRLRGAPRHVFARA